MKHELFEELEAWNPHWQQVARSIRDAAERAQVEALYEDWLRTAEGIAYLERISNVPDYARAIEAQREAVERLPFGIGGKNAGHSD
jgi:uncharacterized protein (UPF0147 family)